MKDEGLELQEILRRQSQEKPKTGKMRDILGRAVFYGGKDGSESLVGFQQNTQKSEGEEKPEGGKSERVKNGDQFQPEG